MSISPPNSSRILTYGQDEIFLETRKAQLKTVGIETDLSLNAEEFLDCITSSERGYDLFILCHTVPPEERKVLVKAAKKADVDFYVLTEFTVPYQFLTHVQQLTRRAGLESE